MVQFSRMPKLRHSRAEIAKISPLYIWRCKLYEISPGVGRFLAAVAKNVVFGMKL